MLKNLKINLKLRAGFGLIIFLILIMFLINYFNLLSIQNSTSNTKDRLYPIMKKSNELIIYTISLQEWFTDLASARDMVVYAEGLVESDNKLNEFNQKIDELIIMDSNISSSINNRIRIHDGFSSNQMQTL